MREVSGYPTLKNSPLLEAVLDVRVKLHDQIELDALARLPHELQMRYGLNNCRDIFIAGLNLNFAEASSSFHRTQLLGYEYLSESAELLFRVKNDGFSVHLLKGYTSWEPFSEMAKALWNFYDQKTGDKTVIRLGLRYLNKFNLPSPLLLGDYLNFYLVGPSDLAASWGPNMNGQLSILNEDATLAGLINIAYSPEVADTFGVLFDIDVSKTENIHKDQLWETFESLHAFKNEIFFKGITPKTLEHINH